MFNFSFYLIWILTILSINFLISSLRLKLIFFLLISLFCSIWGFLYNLDGMILILLTAEFTIFLLFLMTYTQLYNNFSFLVNNFKPKWVILLFIIFIINKSSYHTTLYYTNFYTSLTYLISSDFFILYYLLFDKLPIVTIIVTLVIGLFSLFFIALYFNMKLIKLTSHLKLKNIFFLRKQNILKQTNFKNSLYTFQN